jgi:DNA-binding NarL/FixJ family response regulator
MRDISARKRAEEELQRARDELEARAERRMKSARQYKLTFRELTVLYLVAGGMADKEIAFRLGISHRTASKHVENILGKMGAMSRTEAGVRAIQEGLVESLT